MTTNRIIASLTFVVFNVAAAQFSYMDRSQTFASSVLNMGNFSEGFSKKNSSFLGAAKNHTNTFINIAPHGFVLLSQKLNNEENKKKIEKVIKYNSWYNVESKQWRNQNLSLRDATAGDIAYSILHQVGKPVLFFVLDSKLETLERPAIIEYIPEKCRDAMVNHGKFLMVSGGIELADAVVHLDSNKLDRLSKNTQTYILAHATEAGIRLVADTISPQESTMKSLICFAANMFVLGQINQVIKGKINMANPGY